MQFRSKHDNTATQRALPAIKSHPFSHPQRTHQTNYRMIFIARPLLLRPDLSQQEKHGRKTGLALRSCARQLTPPSGPHLRRAAGRIGDSRGAGDARRQLRRTRPPCISRDLCGPRAPRDTKRPLCAANVSVCLCLSALQSAGRRVADGGDRLDRTCDG